MANYSELLKLMRPSPYSKIRRGALTVAAGLRGETPEQREDTSARDLLSKIMIANMEAERKAGETGVKRTQQIEDLETKHRHKLAEIAEKARVTPQKTGAPKAPEGFRVSNVLPPGRIREAPGVPSPYGEAPIPIRTPILQRKIGSIINTPQGRVKIVGYDTDGQPLIEPLEE